MGRQAGVPGHQGQLLMKNGRSRTEQVVTVLVDLGAVVSEEL